MVLKVFIFLMCILFVNTTVVDYISEADFNRYAPTLVKTLVDLQKGDFVSHYYGLKVFHVFNFELPLKLYWDSCAQVDENFDVKASAEDIYKAITIWTISLCEERIKVLKSSKNKDAPRVQGLNGKLPTDDILKVKL
ncbi:uncharacterized protein LOC108741303 [Agrilus planipennis]|uniref:Uncharacterized protein LOC108741303 n=1 Tax=Agrilus planipennis TaxID=224129 RepID=A0A1W4XFL8_AGRPL|nr:uncharacterized protein LOC108741303 [Agrilus planipennis]